ncbi:tyrosine-type recombinase/integrase, partial [Neobacillus sp. NRS-1170]|uniref:tyrosine-type recombinase/integrase n=1 Tax=Neobacillus sp. NRS-1170 TaxID=3233898 RepID=UPI003D284284
KLVFLGLFFHALFPFLFSWECNKKKGLPDIRFHDLRHSHATILLKANVHPKIVSARLGHSKIQVTMDTYSHLTDSIEAIAVDHLDKLLLAQATACPL